MFSILKLLNQQKPSPKAKNGSRLYDYATHPPGYRLSSRTAKPETDRFYRSRVEVTRPFEFRVVTLCSQEVHWNAASRQRFDPVISHIFTVAFISRFVSGIRCAPLELGSAVARRSGQRMDQYRGGCRSYLTKMKILTR